MGVVYRAVDTRLGRPVAIKMLQAEATANADRNRRVMREVLDWFDRHFGPVRSSACPPEPRSAKAGGCSPPDL